MALMIMQNIFITILPLTGLGITAAVILYLAAKKFYVHEDPRIDEVQSVLPGANCGGCSFPGCRSFAEAAVQQSIQTASLGDLFCPVGGNETQEQMAHVLGIEAVQQAAKVAVVRCNGTKENRKKTLDYDGIVSCRIASIFFSGDTACSYGCLGLGDCVATCSFDAMFMDCETGLPVINEDKCTSCGACVDICPKNIIEIRPKGKKNKRVYVRCVNEDKGGTAKKACSVACIGCQKCVKVCDKFIAIEVNNFLAYIDPDKCRLCRKCLEVCSTSAIVSVNFPPPRNEAPKKEELAYADSNK